MEEKYYLRVGKAADLQNPKDRRIYRLLETLPGVLTLATFCILFFLSWAKPVWVAFFIISFDIYWIFKTIYLSLHLRSAYKRMKQYSDRDWLRELEEFSRSNYSIPLESWRNLYHLIILPMYGEPVEVVRPSFEALVGQDYPKDRFIVVLATEEVAGDEAKAVASAIEAEFGSEFFRFLVTRHPAGLLGEIPGKGSNETWAARSAKKQIIDPLGIPYERIIVSSLDADSVTYSKYFSCLSYHYLTSLSPTRTSYQPISLFINNIWEAPALARIIAFSSTFWHMMNQERPEKHVTFSSHSMSFQALAEIGFWQTNVVSEDSRIFWQCFLFYDGDYRVESLYYPLSMDANVAPTFWRTLKNLYFQQRRWAYGAADVSYYLFAFLKNKKIPFSKKFQYGFYTLEGFHSWATNALVILAFGWVPLFVGGEEFNTSLLSYNLPRVTRTLLFIAMFGIVSSAFTAILLLPPKPPDFGRRKYFLFVLEWFLVPINMIVFGAFPAIEAQLRLMLGKYMGFWVTPKMRKTRIAADQDVEQGG